MKIITKIQYGTDLPYSIEIDESRATAYCPANAVIGALSVGRKIPKGMGDRDREKAISYILKTYPINKEWATLISIIKNNTFDVEAENKCKRCVFGKNKNNKPFLSAGSAQCLKCSENYDLMFRGR